VTTASRQRQAGGFTKWDLLITIVVVALVAGILLPALMPAKKRYKRIDCVNLLKQIGLGFRIYAEDHNDHFPWQVSTNAGGTMEFGETTEVYCHFLSASHLFTSPKVLLCLADTQRVAANAFTNRLGRPSFGNTNLSFFAGLDADETRPTAFLSGERNVSTNSDTAARILVLSSNSPVHWAGGLHGNAGNIGFADGSVQQTSHQSLQTALQNTGLATNRLAIP
jgi:prepilin-type processing-associated H-X9-DG protein